MAKRIKEWVISKLPGASKTEEGEKAKDGSKELSKSKKSSKKSKKDKSHSSHKQDIAASSTAVHDPQGATNESSQSPDGATNWQQPATVERQHYEPRENSRYYQTENGFPQRSGRPQSYASPHYSDQYYSYDHHPQRSDLQRSHSQIIYPLQRAAPSLVSYPQGADHLQRTDFQGADSVQRADSYRPHPQGAGYQRTHPQGADYQRTYPQRADFQRTHPQGAGYQRAHPQGADYQRTYSQEADFQRAHPQGADYQRSDFQTTDFQRTESFPRDEPHRTGPLQRTEHLHRINPALNYSNPSLEAPYLSAVSNQQSSTVEIQPEGAAGNVTLVAQSAKRPRQLGRIGRQLQHWSPQNSPASHQSPPKIPAIPTRTSPASSSSAYSSPSPLCSPDGASLLRSSRGRILPSASGRQSPSSFPPSTPVHHRSIPWLASMGVIEEDTSQETGYPNNAESFANTYPGGALGVTEQATPHLNVPQTNPRLHRFTGRQYGSTSDINFMLLHQVEQLEEKVARLEYEQKVSNLRHAQSLYSLTSSQGEQKMNFARLHGSVTSLQDRTENWINSTTADQMGYNAQLTNLRTNYDENVAQGLEETEIDCAAHRTNHSPHEDDEDDDEDGRHNGWTF